MEAIATLKCNSCWQFIQYDAKCIVTSCYHVFCEFCSQARSSSWAFADSNVFIVPTARVSSCRNEGSIACCMYCFSFCGTQLATNVHAPLGARVLKAPTLQHVMHPCPASRTLKCITCLPPGLPCAEAIVTGGEGCVICGGNVSKRFVAGVCGRETVSLLSVDGTRSAASVFVPATATNNQCFLSRKHWIRVT